MTLLLEQIMNSPRRRQLGDVEYGFPYVYFIIQDNALSYVGFTTSPLSRICDHMTHGRASSYDQFVFFLAPSEDAGKLAERGLITLLQPPCNTMHVRRSFRTRDWPKVLDVFDIDPMDLELIESIETHLERRKNRHKKRLRIEADQAQAA